VSVSEQLFWKFPLSELWVSGIF